MNGIGLNVGLVFQQPVQNVNRLPDATGDEVAEERHVGIRDVVVGVCLANDTVGEFRRVDISL